MLAGSAVALVLLITHPLGWTGGDTSAGQYVLLGQKALLVAGLFAIAGYLGRQAHNHRSQSNWALSLAAQLKTFDAYCQPVDSATTKDELRRNFAVRVFGDQPALKGESTSNDGEALVQKAADLASKFLPGDKS